MVASRILAALLLAAATTAPAQQTAPLQPDPDVEMVVALFRHGVRSPLKQFGECDANKHSGRPWPTLAEWALLGDGGTWGDVTLQGANAATALGRYYARRYCTGSATHACKVYFWADVDERTKETALALVEGFRDAGVPTEAFVKWRNGSGPDPLFHPFKSGCGALTQDQSNRIVNDLTVNADGWWNGSKQIKPLTEALACQKNFAKCQPIAAAVDSVCVCLKSTDTCKANAAGPCDKDSGNCDAPIQWKGRFSYASSATEAFLLEYANNMPREKVAWNEATDTQIAGMLALHELYFDKTNRDPDVSKIEGANLVREIWWTINKDQKECSRIPPGNRFAGLLGHDTNLATVGKLLGFSWRFDNVPGPTSRIPAKDALPAGALVFERRKGDVVHVWFYAQPIDGIRGCSKGVKECDPFRVPIQAKECDQRRTDVCEMTLGALNSLLKGIVDKSTSLSHCDKDQQTCR